MTATPNLNTILAVLKRDAAAREAALDAAVERGRRLEAQARAAGIDPDRHRHLDLGTAERMVAARREALRPSRLTTRRPRSRRSHRRVPRTATRRVSARAPSDVRADAGEPPPPRPAPLRVIPLPASPGRDTFLARELRVLAFVALGLRPYAYRPEDADRLRLIAAHALQATTVARRVVLRQRGAAA